MFPEGDEWRAPRINETCCQRPKLAELLEDVAQNGPDVLYKGKWAQVYLPLLKIGTLPLIPFQWVADMGRAYEPVCANKRWFHSDMRDIFSGFQEWNFCRLFHLTRRILRLGETVKATTLGVKSERRLHSFEFGGFRTGNGPPF